MTPPPQSLIEFAFLAFGSLFVIIDPLATVPTFLAITPRETPAERARMARLASIIAACVLLAFAASGGLIFRFLGITLPAFQFAGCIVLLMVAMDMLRAQRSRVQETSEEKDAGSEKEDIAITPLAVPLMAGPGAITTAILLHNQTAGDWTKKVVLYGCIGLVCFVSYLIFKVSAAGARWLNPILMKIATRIMGLLLAAVAFQFMINAINDLRK
jgi:multiple antibiotic resistance protein